jgi:hypothetical protein
MGLARTLAMAALRSGTNTRPGVVTDRRSDVWCRAGCGRKVKSPLGEVCNDPECHKFLLRNPR